MKNQQKAIIGLGIMLEQGLITGVEYCVKAQCALNGERMEGAEEMFNINRVFDTQSAWNRRKELRAMGL